MKAATSAHILNSHNGLPARNLEVELLGPGQSAPEARGLADTDGRILQRHQLVPLLLNAFGYSTYRGS